MSLDEVFNKPWTRKHDNPTIPAIPAAQRIVYPHSLEDLIQISSNRGPNEKLHAAGSHWALSTAAMSDHTFIETHDPNNVHQAMGKTLYDVIPNCMNDAFIEALANTSVKPYDTTTVSENEGLYPIHIETGKRVYQLYAEIDSGDTDKRSLATLISDKFGNGDYFGPWALQTLGGAGGQTVFGALHTGTHGGDIHMAPMADSVMALHLVADGGKHYWIEPSSFFFGIETQLTDDDRLSAFYGQDQFGGPTNFQIIRNDDVFSSVLVSAGRFGAVYSIVLKAVRQYTLHQERRLTTWQGIKDQVNNPNSPLYTQISDHPNKFLQIAICVTPHSNFTLNYAGVTKRRNVPMAVIPGSSDPAGRPERVGPMVSQFDPLIQAPRFKNAGTTHTYDPDPNNPGIAMPASFLEMACSDGNFLIGILKQVIQDIGDFVSSNGTVITAAVAVAAAAGSGGLLVLFAALLACLELLKDELNTLESKPPLHFGAVINKLRSLLLEHTGDPPQQMAGLFIWQAIVSQTFASQQSDSDYDAISYAVMDGHDYLDKSCDVNVQSIEVFFDATDPMLIAFVDALLAFEINQEVKLGRAFIGYISLRFTGPTRALLGMQKFPVSCAIEVAGLADVSGTTELVQYAITLALNSNFKAIMHWGQRNESNRAQIQERFGDPGQDPNCRLARWRKSLNLITNNGKLDGFSSAFTQQTGLEES